METKTRVPSGFARNETLMGHVPSSGVRVRHPVDVV